MINNSETVVQMQLCPRYRKAMPAIALALAIEGIGLRWAPARTAKSGITPRSDSIQLG